MEYIGLCIIAVLLLVVAYYSSKFTSIKMENETLQARIILRNRMIVAMKRVVENQKYLLAKMEEISNAKSAAELNQLYSSIFKP